MHFVSAQSQEDQISDIVAYLTENFRESVQNQAAPALENFEEKLQALNDKGDISGILDHIISLKDEIVRLPTSHKNTPITIQRIVLLILPLLKLQDDKNKRDRNAQAQLISQVNQLCDIIEASEYALPVKVNSILLIYSIFSETSAMKSISFQRLFELCDRNNQLKIIVDNLKNIESISKEWKLSLEQRRQLLRSCAHALDKNEESDGAFNVLQAYLKTFEGVKDADLANSQIEQEAKRCVILAIKVPNVLDFADILQLNAVKDLQGKNKTVFDFMSLFTNTSVKEFEEKVSQYKSLIEEEKLDHHDIIKKKQYVQISIDDVEIWAIEAIACGIIDAKIDQLKDEIVVKSHALNKDWKSIKAKIGDWKQKFQRMQSILQHTQNLTNQAGVRN
eukprot:403335751